MLMPILFALTAACASGTHSTGRTLVIQDDAGRVALSWDGATVRVYRDGNLVTEEEASSWQEATWSVQLPAYGTPTAPHEFSRVLTVGEITSLNECVWPASTAWVSCGLDVTCGCGGTSPLVSTIN